MDRVEYETQKMMGGYRSLPCHWKLGLMRHYDSYNL